MITIRAVVSDEDWRRLTTTLAALHKAPEYFAKAIERPLAAHAQNRALAEIWRQEGVPPWARLKPGTIREKTRQRFPLDILVRTGALKKSLIGPESLLRTVKLTKGNLKLVLGSRDPKFPIHHGGVPRVGIPARPLLPTDSLLRSWAQEAEGGLLVPMLEEDIRGRVRE